MPIDPRTDAELVSRWLAGDHHAFAAIYDRYADAIYAFALARVRNQADAADVVHDTFVRAADRLAQLREPERLRAWLYAVARNHVLDTGRRRGRSTPTDEVGDVEAGGRTPDEMASADEVAALVWVAAESLQPRDRELLELHLRHGLDGADLADVVGMSPSHLYTAMNRLKDRLSKAVGSLLVARHGSKDCPELGALLTGWDGRFDLDVRSRVTRHVEGCDTCRERRAVLCAPANFSATVAIFGIAAPADVRSSVLGTIGTPGLDPPNGQRDAWRADGFPQVASRARRALPWVALAAVAVLLIVGGVIGVAWAQGGDRDTLVVGAAELSSDPARVASEAPTPTATDGSITNATDATTSTPDVATSPSTTPTTGPPSSTAAASTLPGTALAGTAPTTDAVEPPAATTTTVVPAAPAATTSTSSTTSTTSTTTSSTTTSTTVAAAPGNVVVLTSNLSLGDSTPSGTVTIRNDGGSPAAWSAATAQAGFSVSPASGSLAAGDELALTVSVDRPSLAEGDHTASVVVTSAGGGGNATVTASVERDPVIGSLARTPPVVTTSTVCGTTLVTVVVNATDESGVDLVEVVWSSDNVFATRTPLALSGGNTYTGQVGSFSPAGSRTLTAVVTDTRGNTTQQATTVNVIAC